MKNALSLLPLNTVCFLLPVFILTACLTSCGQPDASKENKSQQKPEKHKIDTTLIAILPLDSLHYWLFEGSKPAELTNGDLQKIEALLAHCINEYNLKEEEEFEEFDKKYPKNNADKEDFIIDLKRYRRQYIPIMNEKGEKEIWINCFCHAYDIINWREIIMDVHDGGNCYFNVKINLTTGKYYDLMVNGEA